MLAASLSLLTCLSERTGKSSDSSREISESQRERLRREGLQSEFESFAFEADRTLNAYVLFVRLKLHDLLYIKLNL